MSNAIPEPNIEVFLVRYVYVTEGDRVIDLEASQGVAPMRVQEFKNLTASCVAEVVGPRGGTKTISVASEWMRSPSRITVSSVGYKPGAGRVYTDDGGVVKYNSFHWPLHAGAPIENPEVDLLLNHLEYLIPDADERKLFIQFLAHMMQHPEERPKIVPLIIAQEHGTGRGWITEMMISVLGMWNSGTAKMAELAGEGSSGQFQNALKDNLLVTIHETKVSNKNWMIDDQVRDKMTEQHLHLNLKYGAQDIFPIYARFLLYSNHVDAVRIPPEDRRMWVLKVDAQPRDEAYYIRLYDWLKADGPENIFWYLKQFDISDFNAGMRAPDTAAKRAVISAAQTTYETELSDCLQLLPDGIDVATFPQVVAMCEQARREGYLENDNKAMCSAKYKIGLRAALQDFGRRLDIGTTENKLKWKGKPVRAYSLRNHKNWSGNVDTARIRQQLDALDYLGYGSDSNDALSAFVGRTAVK